MSGWSLTESDPAIFSALLNELGVKGAQVEELWSLEESALDHLEPVYALIFLFKFVASHGTDPYKRQGTLEQPPPGTWFAHQVINNACATLALLNAVMNVPELDGGFKLGGELENLKSFSMDLNPQTRGEILVNADKVREVHNSFARSNPFDLEEVEDTAPGEAYHYVTYLPIQGTLYELDGLKQLPVSHGAVGRSWTERAKSVIEERIGLYPPGELHFNLMAICGDRLAKFEEYLEAIRAKLASGAASDSERLDLEDARVALVEKVASEREKRESWDFENKIRRHNHVGLAHMLLLELAKAGKLNAQVDVATKKLVEREARQRERELAGLDDE